MTAGVIITVIGTLGLLIAEARERPLWRWAFKPLASSGFLVAAFRLPGLRVPDGAAWLLVAGLALSAIGDVLLVPSYKRAFVAGIASFALAHVAYAAWFLAGGIHPLVLVIALVVFLTAGHLVWRWLDPHVTGPLRLPVRGYVALVSVMAACAATYAASAFGDRGPGALVPAVGGALFYLSDMAVARHRFVTPSIINRAWGLPTYYLAQLLIAASVS